MSYPWKSVGIVSTMGAVALIGITAIEDAPPLQGLTKETYAVDGPAYLRRGSKGPTLVVLPAGAVELLIGNVCNEADCQVPHLFRQLQRNDKITVWREGMTVWQAQAPTLGTYSYRQAVAEMNKAKATAYLLYGALFVAGLVATLFGWRSAA